VQSIVGIAGGWHCFRDYCGGKVPSHTITSFVVGLSFYCCEFHTKWVEPSFVIIGWLSQAVQHQRSAGVHSIIGIAGGWHCFCDYSGGKVPSHTITSFAVVLSFYCCEFHTKWVEPSFVIISWLSHAVRHQRSAGVHSIIGIAGGWHCFCDYGGGKVPSHSITSFAVVL
jgi:hypothetical protein